CSAPASLTGPTRSSTYTSRRGRAPRRRAGSTADRRGSRAPRRRAANTAAPGARRRGAQAEQRAGPRKRPGAQGRRGGPGKRAGPTPPPPAAGRGSQRGTAAETADGLLLPPGAGELVLAGLDPDQRAAAEADSPLMIIAGPGTGKTRTLTHRIAHDVLGRDVAPQAGLAITFTRRAAEGMRGRLTAPLPSQAPG